MNEQERACVRALESFLRAGGYTLDSLQTELYAIPKAVYPDKAEDKNALKEVQGKFFKDVYNLILGRDRGPRLYLYLFAVDPARYLFLLDFSGEEEAEEPAIRISIGSLANGARGGRIFQGSPRPSARKWSCPPLRSSICACARCSPQSPCARRTN